MGFLKLLFHSFRPNPEGVREAMRFSYAKHLRLAKAGRIPVPDGNTCHEVALCGALGSRYRALGQVRSEIEIWANLAPFLMMDASEAVDAVAEYEALKEFPMEARIPWLKKEVTQAVRKLAHEDQMGMSSQLMSFAPFLRLLTDNQLTWWNLLDAPERLLLERRFERLSDSQVLTDEDDSGLTKETGGGSFLREARHSSETKRETYESLLARAKRDPTTADFAALRAAFANSKRQVGRGPDDLEDELALNELLSNGKTGEAVRFLNRLLKRNYIRPSIVS